MFSVYEGSGVSPAAQQRKLLFRSLRPTAHAMQLLMVPMQVTNHRGGARGLDEARMMRK